MIYDWYKILNRAEFLATGLPSRTVELILGDLGLKEILVTIGNYFSITYDDVMLSIELDGKNPFEFEDRAIYVDAADDVWLGIKNED